MSPHLAGGPEEVPSQFVLSLLGLNPVEQEATVHSLEYVAALLTPQASQFVLSLLGLNPVEHVATVHSLEYVAASLTTQR